MNQTKFQELLLNVWLNSIPFEVYLGKHFFAVSRTFLDWLIEESSIENLQQTKTDWNSKRLRKPKTFQQFIQIEKLFQFNFEPMNIGWMLQRATTEIYWLLSCFKVKRETKMINKNLLKDWNSCAK